jgi:hypothetical protein
MWYLHTTDSYFNNKKEESADTWYDMNKTWKPYVELKKPHEHIQHIWYTLHSSIYVRCSEQANP